MKATRPSFTFSHYVQEKCSKQKEINSSTSLHLPRNLVEEALAWYDVQKHKPLGDNSLGMIELVKQTTMFPAVRKTILIALTLPATSGTVERYFSTLRRVKTRLRSTMNDSRLSGLCMLSVHRNKVNSQKTELMIRVIDNFGREPRRLQFLFQV